MAGAGEAVEEAKRAAMEENRGSYLLLVTGSIPTEEDGIYLTVGGRTGQDILTEAADGAAAVIAIGACAHFGSVQAARPNPTGAVGVSEIIRDRPVVNIAGCPPIADVVTATVAHFLTFSRLPDLDGQGRPLFAYGARIHDQCQRRAHFDAGQYVQEFDDEGARRGWCLYEVGCKGPACFSPCPIFQWNDHTDWPIGAGHPCLGCTERYFWDTMTPFYQRLPDVAGFGVERSADLIGLSLTVGAAAGVAAHAVATGVHRARRGARPDKPVTELPVVPSETPASEEDSNG
jgi:hydrogenase small subunit